jgi:hypothetical protein
MNLNELVAARAAFLSEEMSEGQIEDLASELRVTLTFDTMFGMIDEAIWDYLDRSDKQYGQIANDAWLIEMEKNRKKFELVDLVSQSWTIQVPRLKKK